MYTLFISEYLSSLTNPYPYTHIQGSRESYTSPWFYDNGDKITYFNWNQVTHQPDNNPGENWIIVNSRDNCAWHDRLNVELRSVCQLHGQVWFNLCRSVLVELKLSIYLYPNHYPFYIIYHLYPNHYPFHIIYHSGHDSAVWIKTLYFNLNRWRYVLTIHRKNTLLACL